MAPERRTQISNNICSFLHTCCFHKAYRHVDWWCIDMMIGDCHGELVCWLVIYRLLMYPHVDLWSRQSCESRFNSCSKNSQLLIILWQGSIENQLWCLGFLKSKASFQYETSQTKMCLGILKSQHRFQADLTGVSAESYSPWLVLNSASDFKIK